MAGTGSVDTRVLCFGATARNDHRSSTNSAFSCMSPIAETRLAIRGSSNSSAPDAATASDSEMRCEKCSQRMNTTPAALTIEPASVARTSRRWRWPTTVRNSASSSS